jgi:hypothetical protein
MRVPLLSPLANDGWLRRLFGRPDQPAPAGPCLTGEFPRELAGLAAASAETAPEANAGERAPLVDWSALDAERRLELARRERAGAAPADRDHDVPAAPRPSVKLDWSVFQHDAPPPA